MKVGDELPFLRLEYIFRAAFGFHRNLVAFQRGLRLFEVRLAARELRREPLLIRDCSFDLLLRGGLRCEKPFLARPFRLRPRHVCLTRGDSGLRRGDLRVREIDSGRRFLNLRVLQVALPAVVFDRRFRRLNRRSRLRNLRVVVVVFELDQQIARLHFLIVADFHRANDPRHFCAERRQVAPDVGIIRDLLDFPAFPRVPVARDRDDESDRKKKDRDGSDVAKPRPARRLVSSYMFIVFRCPARGWRRSAGSQAGLLRMLQNRFKCWITKRSRLSSGWVVVNVRNG